ncbi:uncharacterized protein LOC100899955 [Galendromus occidentalis]|uniref:Uncharacterized protein LOC100899955 n=1 Tax=Galendromus occidentalis TaxID=34638 RepID=A0AAJ6QP45_9ACAR|nr:uncharacterized protein LOC100899955 [Galendromus occidentalis]
MSGQTIRESGHRGDEAGSETVIGSALGSLLRVQPTTAQPHDDPQKDKPVQLGCEDAAGRLNRLLNQLDETYHEYFDLQACEKFLSERDDLARDVTRNKLSRETNSEMWDTVENFLPGYQKEKRRRYRNENEKRNLHLEEIPNRKKLNSYSVRFKCSMCPSIFDDARTLKLHKVARHSVT